MAWTRGAHNSTASIPNLNMLLKRDEVLNCKEYSTLDAAGGLTQAHLPLTFSPFRGLGNVDNTNCTGAASTTSACSNMIAQAMESMKRPFFWPFLGIDQKVQESFTTENIVEQSESTSEYYNMCNTMKMERMLRNSECSNEEGEINEGESTMMRTRKKKRLTEQQVSVLEGSFEADKKLEAERKQELAQSLGLEPRQVAVWFQNRRARSKTKHLEHDFALLRARYHSMVAETNRLRSEVSRLAAELEHYTKGEGAVTIRPKPASHETPPFTGSESDHNGADNFNRQSKSMDAAAGSRVLQSTGKGNMINATESAIPSSSSPSCCSDVQENVDDGGDYAEYKHPSSNAYNLGFTDEPCEFEYDMDNNSPFTSHSKKLAAPQHELVDIAAAGLPLITTSSHNLLQAAAHHHSSFPSVLDESLLFSQSPLIGSYNHVALDCLWELTT